MEDTSAKLDEYKTQLAQVDELLALDPTNAEFMKLKSDLLEVMQLTQSLAATGAQSTTTAVASSDGLLSVGTLCEAVFGEAWYPATVLEAGADAYKVSFLGYNNEETVPLASVRPLSHKPSLDRAIVTEGLVCEALYVVDGQWHDVQVDSKTERGYMVTFTKFGNSEELPLAYLRLPADGSTSNVAGDGSGSPEAASADPTPVATATDDELVVAAPPPP
eukprot:CAMPEP_0205918234 /NCGR_PEP_ID=MMETSP1325-20131115/9668_1 /ASSEMBLY_ACC=CAM_ASM_000708 /TAXON_ID=236786 /ORGANISM="Florenciella sp., Strain RCC1007" /LENGTH=218 /DNA_ID=CAMNT_0053285739 /DNA_START=9 /DNA_END=661 /DNA_ORIENTATION=-